MNFCFGPSGLASIQCNAAANVPDSNWHSKGPFGASKDLSFIDKDIRVFALSTLQVKSRPIPTPCKVAWLSFIVLHRASFVLFIPAEKSLDKAKNLA